MTCDLLPRVDDHFRARLTIEAERLLREHLPQCDVCRDRYQRQLLLGALSPRARSAKDRLRRGIAFSPPEVRRPARPWFFAFPAVGMIAAALLLWRRPQLPEFVARGPAQLSAKTEFRIYRVASDGKLESVREVISAADELGFTYRNPTGKKRLLIFASDEHGHIYWYHPTWTDEREDPEAIAAAGGNETHQLPQVTRHAFDGKRLRFQALFTDEPVSVKQVETWLKRSAPGPVRLSGVAQVELSLRVIP